MERLLLFACFAFIYANEDLCKTYPKDQNLPGLEDTFFTLDGDRSYIVLACKIPGASRNDSGNYTCVAKGWGNFLYNKTMDIRITAPGQITAEKDGMDTKATESQTLSCRVSETPELFLTWQLEFEYGGWNLTNLRITAYDHANDFGSTLNLTSVERGDDGSYRCNVDHSRRTPIIDSIGTCLAQPVAANSVLLAIGWKLLTSGGERNIRIVYRKNGTEEWCFHSEAVSNGFTVEKIVAGLENGTAYQFKFDIRSDGTDPLAVYSPWITTLEKDLILTTWITATTLHSISIEWSEPPHKLDWTLILYVLTVTDPRGKMIESQQDSISYTFRDLEPNTSYEITVSVCISLTSYFFACCSMNHASIKQTAAVTIDRVIDFVPTLTVEDTTPHSITIGWSAPPPELRDRVHQYKVAATLWDEKEAPVYLSKTVNSFDFENLTSNASYLVKVAACSDYETQCGNWSSEHDAWTAYADKVLGSGAFGVVTKAEAKSIRHSELVTIVAVKMVRATSSLDQMTALSRELKILVHLGKHVNVVNLLGACTKKVSFGQLMVIVEFCRFGNLRDYLLRRRDVFVPQVDTVDENTRAGSSCGVDLVPANDSGMDTAGLDSGSATRDSSHSTDSTNTSMAVGYPHATDTDPLEPCRLINYQGDYEDEDFELISTQDLLSWSWQVARGMKYLNSRRVVHGDLAARNILLADHNVVKICDFGLAKTLYEDENHHTKGHGPLPVKWLAIESLRDHVFSFHSDVWAYGVVLWELFSLAETPYPGIRHDTLYTKLADGFRMPQPKYAARDMYETMLRCWDAEPSQRPSFAELVNSIGDLLDENVKTEYFDLSGPYERMNARDLELGEKDYLTMKPSENTSNTMEQTQV